jgi:hypothetical protein
MPLPHHTTNQMVMLLCKIPNEHKLTIIGSNSEIAILEGPDQSQYAFYFGDADLEKFKQYASVTRNFDGNDEDGNPEYNDDDFDIDEDVLSHFINDNLNC